MKIGGQRRRIRKQEIHPKPGKAAERHFQAAGPIYPDGVGILRVPVLPLAKYFADKCLVSRQTVCFRQSYKMLVAIEFPGNFAVAYFLEIEISDFVDQLP